MTEPIQAADETPLITGTLNVTEQKDTATNVTPPPPPSGTDSATAAMLESSLGSWEAAIYPALDGANNAVDTALSDAIATIRGKEAVVRRMVNKSLSDAMKTVDASISALQAEGIYPAMGRVDREKEMADESGGLMIGRILGGVAGPVEVALPPIGDNGPGVPPPAESKSLPPPVYDGMGQVVGETGGEVDDHADDANLPSVPPPPAVPTVPPPLSLLPPPPAPFVPLPPASPPAVPPPPASPPADCAPWTVYTDPVTGVLTVNYPPNSQGTEYLDNQCLVWFDPVSQQWYNVAVNFRLTSIPPGGYYVDCGAVRPDATRVGGAHECPASPPPPPPINTTCPPGQVREGDTCTYDPTQNTAGDGPTSAPGGGGAGCCLPQPDPIPEATPVRATAGPAVPSITSLEAVGVCERLTGMFGGKPGGNRDDGERVKDSPGFWAGVANGLGWVAAPYMSTKTSATLTKLEGDQSEGARQAVRQSSGWSVFDGLASVIPQASNPNAADGLRFATTLGLVNWSQSITGAPLSYMYQGLQYVYQYLNPQFIPSQAELNQLWLTNRVTSDDWECYTKMQGNLPRLAALSRDAAATRPGPSELVSLFLRGKLGDRPQLLDELRKVGVTDPSAMIAYEDMAKWYPGGSSLIRYMVRDAADPEVVKAGQLDKDFDLKFSGKIIEWAKAQGMDSDTFRYEWYSHWEYPSNTSVYEQVHRLREDRPEVVQWDEQAAIAVLQGRPFDGGPRPPVFTMDDARRVMEINDVAPAHIDGMLAVCFHSITSTDAKRAFMIGFRDKDWLIERRMDNGYTRANAELMAEFDGAERERTITTQTGVMSARKVMSAYVDGIMDRADTDRMLVDIFPDPGVRFRQIEKGDIERQVQIRRQQKAGILKGYVFGEYDDEEAERLLRSINWPEQMINAVIGQFQAKRMSQKKEPKVKMLCEWYTHRLITEAQYYDRVIRLGYTADDAYRMVQVCAADRAAKSMREAAAAAERARKEAKSNLSEIQKMIADKKKELADLEKRAAKG